MQQLRARLQFNQRRDRLAVTAPARRENLLLNLACNIVVPTVVLMKFSSERWLGPIPGLLVALNRDHGITVLMVTHEPDMAAYAHRMVHFVDGRIAKDAVNPTPTTNAPLLTAVEST